MMRVVIFGSRHWKDYQMILRVLTAMSDRVSLVIGGEAEGADLLGKKAAKALGLPYSGFPADWEKHGKSAGPIRNQEMIDQAMPTLGLAFHEDPYLGKGTKDMFERCLKAGIPVRVFPPKKGKR
jgi:hypothetical protein